MNSTKIGLKLTAWDCFLIFGFITVSIIISCLKHNFQCAAFTAGVLSMLCVVFGAKGSKLNFLFGFCGSLLNGYINYKTGLYAMAAIFLIYNVPMQFVGYALWKRRQFKGGHDQVRTRWMNWTQRVLLTLISAIAVLVVGKLLERTSDPQPYTDALAAVVAVVAQIVLTLAFVEQWFMWVAVNVSTLTLWSIAVVRGEPHAAIMLVQSAFYMMNSLYGIYVWSRLAKNKHVE